MFEIADQFLLLRIDRDARLMLGQGPAHRVGDIPKLRVAVRMLTAFPGLGHALKTVAEFVQQLGHDGVAHGVPAAAQRARQGARAQARPAQRRIRVARGRRFDQRIQIGAQGRIATGQPLPPAAWPPDASPRGGRRGALELAQPALNRRARDARGALDLRDAAMAQRARFGGRPQPPRPLREDVPEPAIFRTQGGTAHARTVPPWP